MSRQKRTAPRVHSEPQLDPSEKGLQGPSEDEELSVGNQAQQDLLTVEASMDVVRDAAVPWVERAISALQIGPLDPKAVGRLTEIVERSGLPEAQRAVLVGRLHTDQAVADGVSEVVKRWFQADDVALRDQLSDALDEVVSGLVRGAAGATEWTGPDGERVLLSPEAQQGPVGARVEALVGDLARSVAPAGVEVASIQGFCREIQFTLLWDEEEEEESFGGDYAAEESGA